MDILLTQSSVLQLPSSHRVDAIVYDGTTDLRLWPAPGPDRDLLDAYGDDLKTVLDRERERLQDGLLPIGSMIRLHRGKLHCDFLLWIATRGPEESGIQAPAPSEETLKAAVLEAMRFSAERHVKKIAFPALGHGPDALDETDRLVLISRAASAYFDECAAAGRPSGIEEVLLCHPSAARISAARQKLGRGVSVAQDVTPAKREDVFKSKAAKAKRASIKGDKTRGSSRKPVARLEEQEIAQARATASAYDRARTYSIGDHFVHSKFGVGRVEERTPEGFIVVLFEGGDTRRMLHARP
ncbi:MAG: hypothetical protein IT378_00910 [Sandaracinaceae bacterium]|nr:hypothetical protein [Sandaracinaceae bacterium]